MKEKTKTILKTVGKVLLRIVLAIFKKKGVMLMILALLVLLFARCVNGTMIVVKTPTESLKIVADSMRNVLLEMDTDTIRKKLQ